MEFIYAFLYLITLLIGIYIGLKFPFISDKLGKKIEIEYIVGNKNSNSTSNLTPDIISEWQNGQKVGDNNE